jgi:hypothetical protein
MFRSVVTDDEWVLGVIAPELVPKGKMSARKRRRRIKYTLDRWEHQAGIDTKLRESGSLAARAYAGRAVEGEYTTISLTPGLAVEPVDDNVETLETFARQLRAQEEAVRLGAFGLHPETCEAFVEKHSAVVEAKLLAITERIAELCEHERTERHRMALARLDGKTTADYAHLPAAEREELERALGLELPGLAKHDALSRLHQPYDDRN